MLKKFASAVILIFFIIISPLILNAQNPFGSYNPFVNAGTITPAPLWPVEANGTGMVSIHLGNTGGNQLHAYPGDQGIYAVPLS